MSIDKPEIDFPGGEPPKNLEITDVWEGEGPVAKAGDTVQVHYVGVAYSTGEEFDASWNRGEPLQFRLGVGQVIAGWDQGVQGMKVGGRRQLIIPPELAYGDRGAAGALAPHGASPWPTSAGPPPRSRARLTSSAWSAADALARSRWTRFFPVLRSGTGTKTIGTATGS